MLSKAGSRHSCKSLPAKTRISILHPHRQHVHVVLLVERDLLVGLDIDHHLPALPKRTLFPCSQIAETETSGLDISAI